MRGFRCAGCGRALEEVRSSKFRNERFYCSEFCSEDDEAEKPWPSIWDYPSSPSGS
jgi:transcription initiation factor IIE alpha subunit